jgi:hypothetical protein
MAEEEAVFRCNSKAVAASAKRFCQYKKNCTSCVKHHKVQRQKKLRNPKKKRSLSPLIPSLIE